MSCPSKVTRWPLQVILYLLILLSLYIPVYAQNSTLAGRKITDIQYAPPDVLHPADLENAQPIKVGSPLRLEEVSEAIDRMFATGVFEDIVVETQPVGNDGAILRFVTIPTQFVGGVGVEGRVRVPPNRGELTTSTRLQLGAPLREEELTRATERMNRLFTNNGLHEAEVTPEAEEGGPGGRQAFVAFHVRTGRRARYSRPTIRGDTKLPESTIIRATGWRTPIIHTWRKVTDRRTRGGVQGVLEKYQKQDRLTAKVELTKLEFDPVERRVHPELTIQAGPKIRLEAVEAKVSRRVLKRYVPVFQERAVDNDLLVEGARNLRDYFQSKGYYDVDVDFRMKPVVNDEQVIEYVISLGQQYKLVRVEIVGGSYFSEDDLRERMFMQPASFAVRNGRFSEAFRKRDEENIANLYKANGFREVRVTTSVDRNYGGKTGQVAVTINIQEGPQWVVDEVVVNGVPKEYLEQFQDDFASLAGQPFSEVNLAADRSLVLTWYFSRGYPSADFRASWQQTGPNRAKVIYTVTAGERQFVRDILISGLNTTRPELVEKRITMFPGDPLSPMEQSEIQRRFYDMGVFARVDTAIENQEGDTSYKYILYNFQEANRYTLAVGFGAQIARFGQPSSQSLSSPGGATGFSPQASFSASRLNFRGLGHTVSFRGVYSSLQKRASLSYLAPRFQDIEGRNLTLSLLYDDSTDIRTFSSRRAEASVQVAQRLSKATSVIGRLAYRRVSVSNVVIPVLLVPQFLQPVRLGIISANLVQDRRDDSADPRRGIFNTADVGLATKLLGSQRSFARVLLRNATYHRITRNTVLARQTQFGVIAPWAAPVGLPAEQSVPLPERFFGGGADSLRAFPYNQAGPRDTGAPLVPGGPSSQPTGFPLGGNALLFNNTELRFPLWGTNVGGALFHDMGNVYASVGDISFRFKQRNMQDFDYMVHAVGFGLRYRTPVGPLRVDLAYSINPPAFLGFSGNTQEILQCDPSKPPSELPSFCQSTPQRISRFQFFFSIGQTF